MRKEYKILQKNLNKRKTKKISYYELDKSKKCLIDEFYKVNNIDCCDLFDRYLELKSKISNISLVFIPMIISIAFGIVVSLFAKDICEIMVNYFVEIPTIAKEIIEGSLPLIPKLLFVIIMFVIGVVLAIIPIAVFVLILWGIYRLISSFSKFLTIDTMLADYEIMRINERLYSSKTPTKVKVRHKKSIFVLTCRSEKNMNKHIKDR